MVRAFRVALHSVIIAITYCHRLAATPGTMDKGKARDLSAVTPPAPAGASTPMAGDGGDGDEAEEEGGKGDKKQKNSYRHLIKGIPGMSLKNRSLL